MQNYYRPPTIEELTPGAVRTTVVAVQPPFSQICLPVQMYDTQLTGDIRVVGAMGDFMVAGTGALAEELSESGTDFRGTSFVTGEKKKTTQYSA